MIKYNYFYGAIINYFFFIIHFLFIYFLFTTDISCVPAYHICISLGVQFPKSPLSSIFGDFWPHPNTSCHFIFRASISLLIAHEETHTSARISYSAFGKISAKLFPFNFLPRRARGHKWKLEMSMQHVNEVLMLEERRLRPTSFYFSPLVLIFFICLSSPLFSPFRLSKSK